MNMNTSQLQYHGPGYRLFVIIWAALLCLTGVTVYAAQIDLGFLNVVAALTKIGRASCRERV